MLSVIIVCMTRFFTGKGDDGYTGLLGEGRIPKYHPKTEAVGTVDEATAAFGIARSVCHSPELPELILSIQRDLYGLMAELSATPENAARFRVINADRVSWLEEQTDAISQTIDIPNDFVLPGDSQGGAAFALTRTIVRRAERRVAELLHTDVIENAELLKYLNRLSSLCFVLELVENKTSGKLQPTLAKNKSSK
jgi:cob(I)alamin adenosyltransferase